MIKRLRILYFCPVVYFKGGAERSLLDLVANPAIDPQVAVPGQGPILERMMLEGIKVHVIPFGYIEEVHRPFSIRKSIGATKSTIDAIRLLLGICRREKIDVLHCNGLKAHVIGAAARLFGGPPVVMHIRDIPHSRTERILWMTLRYAADHLILVSRACWPMAWLPMNATIVHNGINISDEMPPPFCTTGPLRIGFIGRIDAAKGLHLLLDWMQQARSDGLNLTLIVRGRFDSTDCHYQHQITNQISYFGLQDSVHFNGFVVGQDSVYSDVDVVCVPSHVPDPLPRSVMEPMARGIPVIAYPAGGILEMIDDLKTGFLVSDACQFIKSIRILQMDFAGVDRIILSARLRIEAEFNFHLLYTKCNKIYEDVARHAAPIEELD